MSQAFVPFVSSSSAGNAGSATENPASLPRQSFSPIATPVSAPVSAIAGHVEANRSGPASHQPTVKVHKEGDTVRRIQIHCSCGQIIDLDCQY